MYKKIAVISDIHSNIFALDAVLEDINSRGIELIVNLGDTLLGPIDPFRTAERLINIDNIINIMGNGDEILLEEYADSQSYKFVKPLLSDDILKWIGSFEYQWVYEDIFFCHGTPKSNSTYLLEEITSSGFVYKSPSKLSFELIDISQTYICCGHSHLSKSIFLPDNKIVINPGSVGLPAYYDELPLPHAMESYTPHAKYATLTKLPDESWKIEHVLLSYDWNKASDTAQKNKRVDYAYALKTGMALRQ